MDLGSTTGLDFVLGLIRQYSLCLCQIIIVNNYINTNEILGEFLRENMISSHVKITCYFHTGKDHCCYGYIINCAFQTEK